MTRKKVTSTYRREYSPDRSAVQTSVIQSYDTNQHYREYRRQVEHGHHKSPFVWDDWEYELAGYVPGPPKSKKAVKIVRSISSDSGSSVEVLPSPPVQTSRKCQTFVSSPFPVEPEYCSEDCNCGATSPQSKLRVQGQPPRVLTDTISKSLKKVSKNPGRSEKNSKNIPVCAPITSRPFVQFGTGDDEVETGAKRTYNVQSPQGVQPTAINAKQRHLSAKELKGQGHRVRQVNSKTELHDPAFDNRMNKQTSKWQSEYSKRYRQFPSTHYRPPA